MQIHNLYIYICIYMYTQCFTICNSWITCPTSIAVPDACTLSSVPLLYFSLLSPQFSGDDPDAETLSQYTSSSKENPGWGPLFQRVKEENGIASEVVNFQQGFSKRHFFQRGVSKLQDLLKCQLTVLFVDPFVLNLCFALSFSVLSP